MNAFVVIVGDTVPEEVMVFTDSQTAKSWSEEREDGKVTVQPPLEVTVVDPDPPLHFVTIGESTGLTIDSPCRVCGDVKTASHRDIDLPTNGKMTDAVEVDGVIVAVYDAVAVEAAKAELLADDTGKAAS